MAACRVRVLLDHLVVFLRDVFYLILFELLRSVKPLTLAHIAWVLLRFQLNCALNRSHVVFPISVSATCFSEAGRLFLKRNWFPRHVLARKVCLHSLGRLAGRLLGHLREDTPFRGRI